MMKNISCFSLDDYINYDSSYKKSQALLHKLLEEGKEVGILLFYCYLKRYAILMAGGIYESI
jgi:hypothetical protein